MTTLVVQAREAGSLVVQTPGIIGPPGVGVTGNSLLLGGFTIQYNSELDTLDFIYTEV